MGLTRVIFLLAIISIVMLFALIMVAVLVLVGRHWLRAFLHGTPVPLISIIAMRLRGNPPSLLIDAYIMLRRAQISTTIGDVENAYIDARNRVATSDDLVELVKKRSGVR